jgi:UDP-2-acetamido-3-amino-2,3-dideoxy-glucuronate N-acetyltransferase
MLKDNIDLASIIRSGTKIVQTCNIGQNVVIESDVVIGNVCMIQNYVSFYKGVTLERSGWFAGKIMKKNDQVKRNDSPFSSSCDR